MQDQRTPDVAVIGSGIAGNLAAAYLKTHLPELQITVVGRTDRRRPVVGESLIEASSQLMHEIGLGPLLIEKHYPKYGLTYYYKTRPDDPSDRTYIVDEPPAGPPRPSYQLNRFTFDEDLRDHNRHLGVDLLEADVTGVQLTDSGRNTLSVRTREGVESTLNARWVVDASGRNRFLARTLGLDEKVKSQRHTFWLRLVDFDPAILTEINAIKEDHHSFDSYYCTHHFFGEGNWVWVIPMRSADHPSIASIGMVWRPDLAAHEIASVDQFLDVLRTQHPVLAELIESGRVLDTNRYRNYMRRSKQRYSEQGWFVLGDAADTVDPLYSLGLAMVAFQLGQVKEMIVRDMNGATCPDFVRDLDLAIERLHRTTQATITDLYEVMTDPFQCHMRMHLLLTSAWRMSMPMIESGYLQDPTGARLLASIGAPEVFGKRMKRLDSLVAAAAAGGAGSTSPDGPSDRTTPLKDFVRVQSCFALNYRWQGCRRESDIPASAAAGFFYLARTRLGLLRKTRLKGFLRFADHADVLLDFLGGCLMKFVLFGKPLRGSLLVRLATGTGSGANVRMAGARAHRPAPRSHG